jgi:hygromycin-B 4-O-kinase
MQVHNKPRLQNDELIHLIKPHWAQPIAHLIKLAEGEDSQAFRFTSENRQFVIRVNKSNYGFKKDEYTFNHLANSNIPVPRVIKIGQLDKEHFFCITEFIEGPTLQELPQQDIENLLPIMLKLQQAISALDISSTKGFGKFGIFGEGQFTSWRQWLLSLLSKPDFDWDSILTKRLIDRAFLTDVFDIFRTLVGRVPNDRQLFHGDFGSNNILVHHGKVAAVLDWDAAGYGDWLIDVAGAYYWRNHLLCMKLAAEFYEKELSDLPNYYARINCYQLRAALIEIYVQAKRKDAEKLDYHLRRTRELLEEIS